MFQNVVCIVAPLKSLLVELTSKPSVSRGVDWHTKSTRLAHCGWLAKLFCKRSEIRARVGLKNVAEMVA